MGAESCVGSDIGIDCLVYVETSVSQNIERA